MAKVTVTRQFKEDFDTWAQDRLQHGDFTAEEMEEMRAMIRKEFTPGPDQLREGVHLITAAGLEVPAAIDDVEERVRLWTGYFADEARTIRARYRRAA